jgi:hypothetical protein
VVHPVAGRTPQAERALPAWPKDGDEPTPTASDSGGLAQPAPWTPLGRAHYFWAMVGAGVLTGILGFLPAVVFSPLADLVAYRFGWLIVLVQAFGIAALTGNLRPWPIVGGSLLGLWGLAIGFVAAQAVFLAFWAGAET